MPNCRVYCRRPRRTHVSPTRGPVKEGDKTFYTRKNRLGGEGRGWGEGLQTFRGRNSNHLLGGDKGEGVPDIPRARGLFDILIVIKGFTDAKISIRLHIVWVGVGSTDFYLLGARMELSGGAYSGKQRPAILAVTDKRRYADLPHFASCKVN